MIKRESRGLLMKRELFHYLTNARGYQIQFLLTMMTKSEIDKIFQLLEYTDQDTIDRWSGIYAEMYK